MINQPQEHDHGRPFFPGVSTHCEAKLWMAWVLLLPGLISKLPSPQSLNGVLTDSKKATRSTNTDCLPQECHTIFSTGSIRSFAAWSCRRHGQILFIIWCNKVHLVLGIWKYFSIWLGKNILILVGCISCILQFELTPLVRGQEQGPQKGILNKEGAKNLWTTLKHAALIVCCYKRAQKIFEHLWTLNIKIKTLNIKTCGTDCCLVKPCLVMRPEVAELLPFRDERSSLWLCGELLEANPVPTSAWRCQESQLLSSDNSWSRIALFTLIIWRKQHCGGKGMKVKLLNCHECGFLAYRKLSIAELPTGNFQLQSCFRIYNPLSITVPFNCRVASIYNSLSITVPFNTEQLAALYWAGPLPQLDCQCKQRRSDKDIDTPNLADPSNCKFNQTVTVCIFKYIRIKGKQNGHKRAMDNATEECPFNFRNPICPHCWTFLRNWNFIRSRRPFHCWRAFQHWHYWLLPWLDPWHEQPLWAWPSTWMNV